MQPDCRSWGNSGHKSEVVDWSVRSGLLPASVRAGASSGYLAGGRHDRRGQAARGQSLWHSWPGTRAAMDSAASPTLMPRRWRSFGGTCSAENPPAPAARRHLGVGNLQRQGTLSRPSSGREHLFEIAGGGAAVQFLLVTRSPAAARGPIPFSVTRSPAAALRSNSFSETRSPAAARRSNSRRGGAAVPRPPPGAVPKGRCRFQRVISLFLLCYFLFEKLSSP